MLGQSFTCKSLHEESKIDQACHSAPSNKKNQLKEPYNLGLALFRDDNH